MKNYRIGIVVGSLRKESFNKKLAQALITLAPNNFDFEFIEIGNLPLYNQDDDEHTSAIVLDFKQQIATKDAIMFVSAEYNRSIPGVLKNALDQGSRPYGKNAWDKKPAGIIGTTPGAMGTALVQQHLRNVLVFLNMPTMNQPEAFIQWREGMIDAEGQIQEKTKVFLQNWLDAFVNFVQKNS